MPSTSLEIALTEKSSTADFLSKWVDSTKKLLKIGPVLDMFLKSSNNRRRDNIITKVSTKTKSISHINPIEKEKMIKETKRKQRQNKKDKLLNSQ